MVIDVLFIILEELIVNSLAYLAEVPWTRHCWGLHWLRSIEGSRSSRLRHRQSMPKSGHFHRQSYSPSQRRGSELVEDSISCSLHPAQVGRSCTGPRPTTCSYPCHLHRLPRHAIHRKLRCWFGFLAGLRPESEWWYQRFASIPFLHSQGLRGRCRYLHPAGLSHSFHSRTALHSSSRIRRTWIRSKSWPPAHPWETRFSLVPWPCSSPFQVLAQMSPTRNQDQVVHTDSCPIQRWSHSCKGKANVSHHMLLVSQLGLAE